MATASTGRLFRETVEYYGRGILIVLPLAEFFNFTRKQRADSIPKGKVQALIETVNNQDNAIMMKTFKLLVALLKGWIDYSSFNFSLAANKVDGKEQSMNEVKELRDRLALPIMPFTPFSREIDIKPVDRWELLASISGWDSAYDTALTVSHDDGCNSTRVESPCTILGETLGQHYAYRDNNFTVGHTTDVGVVTMMFLIRLLCIGPNDGVESLFGASVLDCRGKSQFNVQERATDFNATQRYLAMLLDQGWVLVLLLKEDGSPTYNEAVVFAHEDESGPSAELGEAVSRLGLGETVKIVYVNVPRPQQNASGIHALCHILALRHCGYHWVNQLSDNNIMDIRHALLRATSMAFICGANAEESQGDESQGEDPQGEDPQGEA